MTKKYYRRKKGKPSPAPRQRRGDYRIFIGAFLTGPLAAEVQAIREKYDWKTSQISRPHVTLAGTYWRLGPATAENEMALIKRLKTEAAALPAIRLQLGGIYTFGKRVVYLGVMPDEALKSTRKALTNIAGRDKHRKFKPHLTLAMRLNEPEMAEMVAALQASQWHTEQVVTAVDKLHLMQRGSQDAVWRSIFEFPLLPHTAAE